MDDTSLEKTAVSPGSRYGSLRYSTDSYNVRCDIFIIKKCMKKITWKSLVTWDDFVKNCDVLKEAGIDAVVGSLGDSWTIQVPYLGESL